MVDSEILSKLNKLGFSNEGKKKAPKIFIFDVETAPMRAYVWKRFKENISLPQTISESFMICWSGKFLGDDEVFGSCLTPTEMKDGNDKRIVERLRNYLDMSDLVIAYNGKSFDIPYTNTRCLVNHIAPYKPIQVIDPYIDAKKTFRFSSNSMDEIATMLGVDNKLSTDFMLWRKCMEGDKESLDYMFKYNQKDVLVLEDIFIEMRPWLKMPSICGYFDDKNCCVSCGSDDIEKLEGKFFYTPFGKYQLYRCKDCGKIFRDNVNLNMKKVPFIYCTH